MINQNQMCNAVEDQHVVMLMDKTTLSEVINVSEQLEGYFFGNTQANVDIVMRFAENEGMELNCKNCMKMIIEFKKSTSPMPPVQIDGHNVFRTKSYKLLRTWLDNDLKWKISTDYITKKAAMRLY